MLLNALSHTHPVRSVATFEQQGLSPEDQFGIFSKGLVGVARSQVQLTNRLIIPLQFNIASEENGFHGDKLRELPDPILARDEVFPDPDSIPLDILFYPTESRRELDFAAYEDPIPITLTAVDGPDAV